MTEENCRKYMEEATDEKDKKFWADRIERKYPEKKVIKEVCAVKPKTKKKVKE